MRSTLTFPEGQSLKSASVLIIGQRMPLFDFASSLRPIINANAWPKHKVAHTCCVDIDKSPIRPILDVDRFPKHKVKTWFSTSTLPLGQSWTSTSVLSMKSTLVFRPRPLTSTNVQGYGVVRNSKRRPSAGAWVSVVWRHGASRPPWGLKPRQ